MTCTNDIQGSHKCRIRHVICIYLFIHLFIFFFGGDNPRKYRILDFKICENVCLTSVAFNTYIEVLIFCESDDDPIGSIFKNK